MLVFLLFLLYESKSELSNDLLAQAFVAIATSSGARKRKTGKYCLHLNKLKKKVKVLDAKIKSALETMHFGRMKNNTKVKWLQKLLLDRPLFFCHLPRWQNQTSESFANCHVRFLLVPQSGAAWPSLTPIIHPPCCPTANAASMGLLADLGLLLTWASSSALPLPPSSN